MLGTFVLTMRDNRNVVQSEESQQVGGWEQFMSRMPSQIDRRRNQQTTDNPNDAVWLYVGISALYFFLITVVLIILLLAPKWKPSISDVHSSTIPIMDEESQIKSHISIPTTDISDYSTDESKESFQGSARDPLYDTDPLIDPRSSIFRGDGHKWIDIPTTDEKVNIRDRVRTNSKFLQN